MSQKRRQGNQRVQKKKTQPDVIAKTECTPAWSFAAVSLVAAIVILVLFQGGYFNDIACVVGFVLGLVALGCGIFTRSQKRGVSIIALLLFCAGCLALVSAMWNGLTLTTLSESAYWLSISAAALLCREISKGQKNLIVQALCWFGVACAVLGVLIYAQAIPLEGALHVGRLQFTFQYANTAGIWFAVIVVLVGVSANKQLFNVAFLPIFALLLTQSGGAIALFCLAVLYLMVQWVKRGDRQRAVGFMCQAFIAAAAFVACLIAPGLWALLWLIMAAVIWYMGTRALSSLVAFQLSKMVVSLVVLTIVVFCIAAGILLGDRIIQASQTFIERFIQMADALSMIISHLLLGIGPDNWRYWYPYHQSAQYNASTVHNSYLQFALDAGIVALFLFCMAIVVGLRYLAKQKQEGFFVAAMLIVLHALIDFDFQFASIIVLLVLLLSDADTPVVLQRRGSILSCCMSVLLLVVCAAGLWASLSKLRVEAACLSGDVSSARNMIDENNLMQRDEGVRVVYMAALLKAGNSAEVVSYSQAHLPIVPGQAMIVAGALAREGNLETASDVVVEELNQQPFNLELFTQAKVFFEVQGISDSVKLDYLAVTQRADDLSKLGPAALLGNQKDVDVFTGA